MQHVPRIAFHYGEFTVGNGTAEIERNFKALGHFPIGHMPVLPTTRLCLGIAFALSEA